MEDEIKFAETDFKHAFTETSEFSMQYPKYRDQYIRQTEKYLIKAMEKAKLTCTVDFKNYTIEIKTNDQTRDPCVFLKGIDFLKLVGRGLSIEEAIKVMDDDVCAEIIDIRSLVSNEKTFERRRKRLIGKDSTTLKALKSLCDCQIYVQGKTVCVLGGYKGVEEVKTIVLECMSNIHPVYQIKTLIEKRKLSQDPDMQKVDWDQYLPKIKKSKSKSKKKVVARPTGGMPEEPRPRKEDLEMETGEYFLKQSDEKIKLGKGKDKPRKRDLDIEEKERRYKKAKEEKERKKKLKEEKYQAPIE